MGECCGVQANQLWHASIYAITYLASPPKCDSWSQTLEGTKRLAPSALSPIDKRSHIHSSGLTHLALYEQSPVITQLDDAISIRCPASLETPAQSDILPGTISISLQHRAIDGLGSLKTRSVHPRSSNSSPKPICTGALALEPLGISTPEYPVLGADSLTKSRQFL